MPDIESIASAVDLSRKVFSLMKKLTDLVTAQEQPEPTQRRDLREILLAVLTAIDETERYAKLVKKHRQTSSGKQEEISEMWKKLSKSIEDYMQQKNIPLAQEINLSVLSQLFDRKATGWISPEGMDQFNIEIYKASLKELRKNINSMLDNLNNQMFREDNP